MKSMTKQSFISDFEINASVKMLYPYISTASGLSQWFADDVKIDNEDKSFNFIWENDNHKAKMVSHRLNHFVKFEFIDDNAVDNDPSFVEIRLEQNELTQTVFLHIVDYSDFDDMDELRDLWSSLVENLKATVGG
jgi:uncharacterized protein YndB with AHSA1/START domain